MSDLVKRLRALQHFDVCYPVPHPTCEEAAKTIESLRAELAKVNMDNDRLTRTNQAKREHRDKLLAVKRKDADRIEQLEAALRAIDEQFADAAQDDCENGVRWLNKRAAEKYLYEYPHTSAAISFAQKVARAALNPPPPSGETNE